MVASTVGSRTAYRLYLGPHPGAAPCARIAMERPIRDWGLLNLLEDARLIVAELVANAARLGEIFEMRLKTDGAKLRIEVIDRSHEKPVMRDEYADDESEGGRGLLLVNAFADRWGFKIHEVGKTVWAELDK
ncbi:MAG: hypothetical protein JWR24_3427 [Actinoallomurus sp.]|jgi:hypothetical protein|nr:hypothetical protein [Actinoallomurus sp.]